ncbi:hypothetical protein [Actinoplanes sp. GCM10030250]|uniref:hypothetical protein n=1 Tax=Actinoplanes sp. GCM10030250 TaxID=3273376 RepID=UPI003608D855
MTRPVNRPLAVAAAIAVAAFGAFAAPAPASAHWSCGRAAPSDRDTSGNHIVYYNSVPSRVGSSRRCAIQENYIFQSDRLDYHCYTRDIDNTEFWTYVVVVGQNKRGWIRESDLADGGSNVRCVGDT